jgi:hypothetical protein
LWRHDSKGLARIQKSEDRKMTIQHPTSNIMLYLIDKLIFHFFQTRTSDVIQHQLLAPLSSINKNFEVPIANTNKRIAFVCYLYIDKVVSLLLTVHHDANVQGQDSNVSG